MRRTLALLLACSLGFAHPVRAAETVTILSNIPVSGTTGEKPQSKLWQHAGHWWAVFASSGGTFLFRLETDRSWTKLLRLATSTSFKADVKSFGDVAHVLLYASSAQLVSLEYVPSLGTYMPWSQRGTPTPLSLSGSETATLDLDTTGRLWVASESGTNIRTWWSDFPYSTFNGPLTLANNIKSDDIGFVVALPLPLPSKIGVFWSNQLTKRFAFRTHLDTDPPATWSGDESPASQSAQNVGGGLGDDHMNGAVGSDGTLYVAVKTSFNSSSLPLVGLLVRHPNGAWDKLYEVERGAGTRGIALLNEDLDIVRVVYTQDSGGGNIFYRDSARSPIAFDARKTLFSGNLNNPTSTKDNWTDQLVVVASGRAALFTETGVTPTTSSTSTSSTSTTSTSRTTTSSSSTSSSTVPGATTSTSTTVIVTTTSSTTTTTITANVVASITADVSVVAGSSTRFGTATKLEVDNSPVKHTFIQFSVTGTGGHAIQTATLRLRVATSSGAESETRGRVHAASCNWTESMLSGTTSPQPTIQAAVLSAPAGAANPGDLIDFDVRGAITGGDGTYCVALDSVSTDGVDFVARDASTNRPAIVVTVAP